MIATSWSGAVNGCDHMELAPPNVRDEPLALELVGSRPPQLAEHRWLHVRWKALATVMAGHLGVGSYQ